MSPPAPTLLKYDHPVMVSKDKRSPMARSLKVNPQPSLGDCPVPSPPKPRSLSADANMKQTQEILNGIFPPREWMEDNQLCVQQVSSTPGSRTDAVNLQEQLDLKLRQREARETGICPIRRELYSQCFDELIRHEAISCADRGLLLLRLRNELRMTIDLSKGLYESGVAFGNRKALQGEQGKAELEQRICDLEAEKLALEKQMNELNAECEAIEKRENERRQVEEKMHTEEVQFIERMNQQLEAQLEAITTSKE